MSSLQNGLLKNYPSVLQCNDVIGKNLK